MKISGMVPLLGAMVMVSTSFTSMAEGPELGKAAPTLTLSRILQAPSDAEVSWQGLRGKVVVIDFWATWCGPCVKSIPHWNELVDAFKDKPVQFLAITDENEQVVQAFLKKTPIHSWVGLDGFGKPMRDVYGVNGIPTTVLVSQQGLVVADTHPAKLQAKDIQEVLDSGRSSLPTPALPTENFGRGEEVIAVPQPAFEVTARRSQPVPRGHGFDFWQTSATNADVFGQYASVRRALLTFFNCKEPLLDCRAELPAENYDFVVRLPGASSLAEREKAVAPMLRSVFGLQAHRDWVQREVYVMTTLSNNAPGLRLSDANSRGGGGSERGGLKLGRMQLDSLTRYLEGWLAKAVYNETGLTNRYDIRLKWKLSQRELADPEADPDPEAIVMAVREQLGINLVLQRRSVPVLVVEKANVVKTEVQ